MHLLQLSLAPALCQAVSKPALYICLLLCLPVCCLLRLHR